MGNVSLEYTQSMYPGVHDSRMRTLWKLRSCGISISPCANAVRKAVSSVSFWSET